MGGKRKANHDETRRAKQQKKTVDNDTESDSDNDAFILGRKDKHYSTGKRKANERDTNKSKKQKTGNDDKGSDTDEAFVEHDHQYCVNNDQHEVIDVRTASNENIADTDDHKYCINNDQHQEIDDTASNENEVDSNIFTDITIENVKLEKDSPEMTEKDAEEINDSDSDDTISLDDDDYAFIENTEVQPNDRSDNSDGTTFSKTVALDDKTKRVATFDKNGVWIGNKDLDVDDPYFSDVDQFEISYEIKDDEDYLQKQHLNYASPSTKKKKVKVKNTEAVTENKPSNKNVDSTTGKVSNFDCIYCPRPVKPNRSELYRHYSQYHHRKDILEYIKQYHPENLDSSVCPVCERDMKGTSKLIDHLGQVHDVVEKFIPQWARISKQEAVILGNNLKKTSKYF